MVLQHIILNIEQMLDVKDKFDRKHAGFSFHYILENKLQLAGDATVSAPGQAGYSDQCMREVDSAVILSQHNGYKMMHSKRIQEENNSNGCTREVQFWALTSLEYKLLTAHKGHRCTNNL